MPPPDLAALPAFLTIPEVAAVLRISRSSAYEAAQRGELPTVRFGRRLRVPRYALAKLAGLSPEQYDAPEVDLPGAS
jgi:excisionase family DNA binding protein